MAEPLVIVAPVDGTVVAMGEVADPVFAQEIVGPGVAIQPSGTGPSSVVAAVAGTLAKLHPHAYVLATGGTQGVLVHLGIDTVKLGGEGFVVHAADGDEVVAGQPMITWDPAQIAAGGLSTVCPVVALDAAAQQVQRLVEPGQSVRAGDPLLRWG